MNFGHKWTKKNLVIETSVHNPIVRTVAHDEKKDYSPSMEFGFKTDQSKSYFGYNDYKQKKSQKTKEKSQKSSSK